MIETLRGNGVSDDEIITKIAQKDIGFWENVKPAYDFNELIKLYDQDPQKFLSILSNGYTVKFITINGLHNLLKMKFDKIKDHDYQLTDSGISHLKIEQRIYPVLKQMLSKNWVIHELSEQNSDQPTKDISILLV